MNDGMSSVEVLSIPSMYATMDLQDRLATSSSACQTRQACYCSRGNVSKRVPTLSTTSRDYPFANSMVRLPSPIIGTRFSGPAKVARVCQWHLTYPVTVGDVPGRNR